MIGKRNFAPASETGAARRTILIVEDEILVRLAAAEHLRDAGYKVLEATNAAEAVQLIMVDRTIELVFSDVHMPGEMDGNGLHTWILQERPYIKVLLTSGTDQAATGNGSGRRHVIGKPYGFAELERWIRELLGI
jgi:CheY-like chemotaxis protein